ncbi:MAG: triose-phosphate isomerase [Sedimentisphaerales bacterium]|nr:triose-phosphate isomerase [Sedimentisphaerales bacterium]
MRKPFIAGNWKMNTNYTSALGLARRLVEQLKGIDTVDSAICVPFVYLQAVSSTLSSSNIALGAQDVFYESNGAFTGEISCEMLKDVGCTYAIIGHSERRHVIGETDVVINKKVRAAIAGGLLPIFCVGELLEEREAGKTEDVVVSQIRKGLEGVDPERVQAVTIAYEPVWAIGTGKTATAEQAQQVHAMIRSLVAEMYDKNIAERMRIQYGGSAKPSNTTELMANPDVDGLLVGGASLKVEDFSAMIKTVA